MTAALGASFMALERPSTKVVMQPSFVIEFASLLLLGPNAATLLAIAGAVMQRLINTRQSVSLILMRIAGITLALQGAGFVHRLLGGSTGQFAWPAQVLPIAAATLMYCGVVGVSEQVVEPLARKQAVDPSWWKEILSGVQTHVVGVSVAVGCAELVHHGAWELLLIAAVPMFFAYGMYKTHLDSLSEEEHRREIVDALDHGMCVLDNDGRITLWSDASVRILECPRERAIGSSLTGAVRALEKTELPRVIGEAQSTQTVKTVREITLRTDTPRTVEVRVVPMSSGVTLLWHDVTARAEAERILKRNEERLALAAEGAKPVVVDDRVARTGAHRPPRRVDESSARGRPSAAEGSPRASSVWKARTPVSRAQDPSRERHVSAFPRPRCGRTRRWSPACPDRRIAYRYDGAGDRPGALANRRVPRSAHRAPQSRDVRRRARPSTG
jgi:PAS domain S-box-containing protein